MVKKNKVFGLLLAALCLAPVLSGCLKENNTTVALLEIGTAANVIPGEIRTEFESKMDIYEGTTPPDITSSFVIAENELSYSSDGYDANFADHYMMFYNKKGNRYQYKAKQVESISEASDVIVIGREDTFTAYFTSVHEYDDGVTTCVTADLISGRMTSSGIRDIKHAFIMLEKNDPDDRLMEENEFRVFYDGDGLAAFESWDYTKAQGASAVKSDEVSDLAKSDN